MNETKFERCGGSSGQTYPVITNMFMINHKCQGGRCTRFGHCGGF